MVLALLLCVASVEARFLEKYFEMYPTRATQAGRADFDRNLEDLSPARLGQWLAFLGRIEREAKGRSIDREVLRNAIEGERFALSVRDAPGHNPLFWTNILSDAVIYLLLREDQPMAARVAALEARSRAVPRLVAQAKEALSRTPPERLAPELVKPAAQQAAHLAELYASGLPQFASSLAASGQAAGAAVRDLARFLEGLQARGSARLGDDYAEAFRIGLRIDETPAQLLPRFEADLAALRAGAAEEGRRLWPALLPSEPPPQGDEALLRRLFSLAEEQHDTEVGEYARFWQGLIPGLQDLARGAITLPEPLTLRIFAAPPYLEGQAYGGVFPAGPYRPDGDTLLLLPVPPPQASREQREEFFRAFNRPFSRMIAAHEVMPGHYLQLKIAAHQRHPIRAVFPDNVYAEGWGTFAERIMLERGWGGPLERLAHLKKQLENCARAIVDVRVHALGASREEVMRIVRDQALQDPQLAENLWQRTLTSAPQIVTYHLGYRQIDALYRAARARPGFDLKRFSDALTSQGAIPLRHYAAVLEESAGARR